MVQSVLIGFVLYSISNLIFSNQTYCHQLVYDMRDLCMTSIIVYYLLCVQLSSHIQSKLDSYIKVLRTTKITVENIYQFHTHQPIDHRFDCCNLLPADLR